MAGGKGKAQQCKQCGKELKGMRVISYFPDKYGCHSIQRFCSPQCLDKWLKWAVDRDMAEGIIYCLRRRTKNFYDDCFDRLKRLVFAHPDGSLSRAEKDMAVIHICVQTSRNEEFRRALIHIFMKG